MNKYISWRERGVLPPLAGQDPRGTPQPDSAVRMGRVEIDNDLCNGCRLCVLACPASSLEMTGKRSVAMTGDLASCIGCGDCIPICHPGAIRLVRFMEYDGLYKYIGRGDAVPPRRF